MYKYKKPSFWREQFSFAGAMTAGEFWSGLAIRVISYLCSVIILAILIVVVLPAETETLVTISEITACVMAVIFGLSILATTRRRLRDAGFTAKSYLWLLLPVVGWLIFIIRLCAKSEQIKK